MQKTSSHTPILSSNAEIEFAIWLLTHEGINYPPFNRHKQKSSPHFTKEQWYQWLRRLVRNYDGRLSFDGVQFNSKDTIDSTKDAFIQLGVAIPESEWQRAYNETEQYDIEAHNINKLNYQKALEEWDITPDQVNSDTPYYQLPECPPYIKENYQQLWKKFTSTRSRVTDTVLRKYFDKKLDVYTPHDNINVYFVEYHDKASVYVYPNTVIVSVLDEFNSREDFIDYIQKSLDSLVPTMPPKTNTQQ